MNKDFLKELLKTQKSYEMAPTCQREINNSTITRPVLMIGNDIIAAFPADTSENEISRVASVLHADLVKVKFTTNYRYEDSNLPIANAGIIYGEYVTIPGIVQNNVILQVFPMLKGNYSQTTFDSIKGVAELLEGEVKSIVYRAYYSKAD